MKNNNTEINLFVEKTHGFSALTSITFSTMGLIKRINPSEAIPTSLTTV